jgi:radical SAM superfamily enzyme YgiQ (UPF0313 family)
MSDALLVQVSANYLHYGVRSNEPQLGLFYIAEWAYKNGFDVKIKMFSFSEPILQDLVSLLNDLQCRFLGFYVDNENIWALRRLIPEIKQTIPSIKIVVGGPQVTGNAEFALHRLIMADYAIVGEGEIAFSELLSIKEFNYDSLIKIHGLVFYENEKYVHAPPRKMVSDLDMYGYPKRERFLLDKDITFYSLITGRGCIGQCTFCYEGSKTHNSLRLRSVESCVEEFDYLVKNLNNKYIAFSDDTFILYPERTRKFCEILISKYHGEIKWFCEARADILLKNIDLLPLMKEAGLVRVQLGGESGSQSILDFYKKGIKKEQLESVVDHLYNVGMSSVYINFIIGGAFETLDTFNQTLDFAISLMDRAIGCVEIGSSIFAPSVGSPMYNNPEQYGIKIIDKELVRGLDGHIPFVETNDLNQYKVLQLKTIFDDEIDKNYFKSLPLLSEEIIMMHYQLDAKYGTKTKWYQKANTIERYKNYFEPIVYSGFKSIKQLSLEKLPNSIPFRTTHPISDGSAYYRKNNAEELVRNTKDEEQILLLSAGKLTYGEIRQLLLNGNFYSVENIDKKLIDIYNTLDKEYNVVWKNTF